MQYDVGRTQSSNGLGWGGPGTNHVYNGVVLRKVSSGLASDTGGHDYLLYTYETSSSTDGGTATSGSPQTYPLNTEVADTGGHGSLSSNVITLAAGTYEAVIHAQFHDVNQAYVRLRDTDNNVTLVLGSQGLTHTAENSHTVSSGAGRFTLAAETAIELQYEVDTTASTTGLGNAPSPAMDEDNRWGWVELRKVSNPTATEDGVAVLQYENQQSSGTPGGTATSGSWQTCTLNTEVLDTGGHGTLSSNEITLDAGTYEVEWAQMFSRIGVCQTRLYNVTDSAAIHYGLVARSDDTTTDYDNVMSTGRYRFILSSSKTIRMEYYVTATRSSNGLGTTLSTGSTNTYAFLHLRKVA